MGKEGTITVIGDSKKEIPFEETIVSFGLIMRGSLKDFRNIKEFITHYTNSEIVYQTKSLGKLRISQVDVGV